MLQEKKVIGTEIAERKADITQEKAVREKAWIQQSIEILVVRFPLLVCGSG